MKRTTRILLPLALLAGTAVPASAQLPTITDIVSASGGEFDRNPFDYDVLLNAVIAADLADALADESVDLTVFAPNDRAFFRLARDLGYRGRTEQGTWEFLVDKLTDLGGGDPIPVLTDVLLYHVAPVALSPLQVVFSPTIPTLQGATIRPFLFQLRDNDPELRNPFLFFPLDVRASNGVIHTITRVLLPIDLP